MNKEYLRSFNVYKCDLMLCKETIPSLQKPTQYDRFARSYMQNESVSKHNKRWKNIAFFGTLLKFSMK